MKGDKRGFESSVKNRIRARNLLYWLFSNYHFVRDGKITTGYEGYEAVYSNFLARQAWTLISYKNAAWGSHIRGDDPSITPSRTREAIQMTLCEGPAWSAFNRLSPMYDGLMLVLEGYSFAWNKPTYAVSKIPSISFPFPYGDGHVYGDRSVANAFKISVNITPRRLSDNDTKAWVTYNAMT
ncbi:hypothetical protein C0991_012498 [Blastosporella zonata]|nr:hypothetical protein C0991_012498 [Blastosporella zonata]